MEKPWKGLGAGMQLPAQRASQSLWAEGCCRDCQLSLSAPSCLGKPAGALTWLYLFLQLKALLLCSFLQ